MKKHIAFTLAETLVVIGIIGVVSALTLPNLNSSTGDKEKVAQVKKIYTNLNDAYGRAVAKYGPYGTWFINDANDTAKAKRAGERITEFMKLSKNCAMNASQGCFTSGNTKILPGTENYNPYDTPTDDYKVITADGTSISFLGNIDGSPNIVVDIDGPNKGSYTLGKDIFFFDIDANSGILPTGNNLNFSALLGQLAPKGDGAAAWIIKYDNADYLKFNTSGLCSNGTTVTEANPRCK